MHEVFALDVEGRVGGEEEGEDGGVGVLDGEEEHGGGGGGPGWGDGGEGGGIGNVVRVYGGSTAVDLEFGEVGLEGDEVAGFAC